MPFSTISSLLPRVFTRRHPIAHEPTSQLVKRNPTEALLYYQTPGIAPPSARIDPKLKVAARRPPRLWEYWKFAAVAATKATHVTSEVLSHKIWGPRRKTWGIEMTILTSLIREIELHADLVDLSIVRMAMSLTGLAPLPSDAIVTPVTFTVRRRDLRGILADFDAVENGDRELQGEWVVGRRTWQRLQHEWKSGALRRAEGDTARTSPRKKERVILYIHGGAYYLSSAAAQRIVSIPLSKWADARVFALDYRLAPETCFPGPLHDAVSAYFRLTDDLNIPPENIILAGDSAGGGLSLALLLYLRDNNYPLPSAAILMSPWCDLTLSCESWDINAAFDVVPFPRDNHMNPIALYLGANMEKYLTHPYVSPLFGDLTGLPPLLIQAGDAEVLRDEITLFAHKATLAGVKVVHELYEDCIHVFQAYPFLDASKQAFSSIRNFVKHVLPEVQSHTPQHLPHNTEHVLEKEIESLSSVLVNGDGTEMDTNDANMNSFENDDSFSQCVNSDSDTDREVPPSWAKSPGWERHRHSDYFPHVHHTSKRKETTSTTVEVVLDTSPRSVPHNQRPHVHSRSRSQTLFHPRPIATPLHSFQYPGTGLAMTAVHDNPPPPAIRRSARSNSHPNLASLVDHWTRAGPANRTSLYPALTTS